MRFFMGFPPENKVTPVGNQPTFLHVPVCVAKPMKSAIVSPFQEKRKIKVEVKQECSHLHNIMN